MDLKKIYKYNKMINMLENELNLKREEIDNINITYGEIKYKINNSLAEEKALKIVELEGKIKCLKEKRDKAIFEVRKIINKLEDENLIKLMELRYVQCMKWGDIAEIMEYSDKHIFYIHNRALKKIYKK